MTGPRPLLSDHRSDLEHWAGRFAGLLAKERDRQKADPAHLFDLGWMRRLALWDAELADFEEWLTDTPAPQDSQSRQEVDGA